LPRCVPSNAFEGRRVAPDTEDGSRLLVALAPLGDRPNPSRFPPHPMRAFILGFLLAVVVSTACADTGAASTFVQVRNRQFVAPGGEVLKLRGTSLGTWLLPEGYMLKFRDKKTSGPWQIEAMVAELIGDQAAAHFWRAWWDNFITRDDIQFLKRAGFNHVRVPFNWRLFVTARPPYRMEGPGWELLDRAVNWCREAGLYVLLDMHGAPGGQTGTQIDDSRGYPFLFIDEESQQLTVDLWREIARRYRDETVVLGYEPLNEPIGHMFDTERLNPRLAPLYQRIIAAIREVDPHHIVFLGGAQWNTNFEILPPPTDPNIAYTFHTYWTPGTDVSVIERYLRIAWEHKVPLHLGESGENTDEWVAGFRRTLEENGIGWCFWTYKRMAGTKHPHSSILSIPDPVGWDKIVDYAMGPRLNPEEIRQHRPPLDQAAASLRGLLENIRFEKNTLNPGYLRALGLDPAAVTKPAP
jgi:endoglucanase